MRLKGMDQSDLAVAIGATQGTISKILLGKTANSRLLPRIAALLGVELAWLLGMSDDRSDAKGGSISLPGVASADNDDTVEIDSLDMAYGMGGTFVDYEPGAMEVTKAQFSRAWLRKFTQSPPKSLFTTSGVGDSMSPTIHDQDLVIVDRSVRPEDVIGEKIWAIVYGGLGSIKRLRPMPDGTMKIFSDNPTFPPEIATDGELFVVGRVVASVRRH